MKSNDKDVGEKNQRKAESATHASQTAAKSKSVMCLKLLAKSKDQKDRTFKFEKERIVLGSVVSADIHLTGTGISPIHAVIEFKKAASLELC